MQSRLAMLRKLDTPALALALLMGATTAGAEHVPERGVWRSGPHDVADGSLVDVQVRVGGRTAPLHFRPGTWDRHYFQAFKGRNYSLVVRNNTGRRVGVLIAVDGLNVVNGLQSSLSRHEPMYVLDPYERAEIRGWRTSLDDVRRFVFVDEERSYAERTGQANGDLGWIRVLSFREVEPVARRGWIGRLPIDESDLGGSERREPRESGERAPEASRDLADRGDRLGAEGESFKSAPESSPGTGWGRRQHDPVRTTRFLAARSASDEIVLRYEYASGLRALGIFPRRSRLWEREEGQLGFAQPPRW